MHLPPRISTPPKTWCVSLIDAAWILCSGENEVCSGGEIFCIGRVGA